MITSWGIFGRLGWGGGGWLVITSWYVFGRVGWGWGWVVSDNVLGWIGQSGGGVGVGG